jgi:DNA adenine methylase
MERGLFPYIGGKVYFSDNIVAELDRLAERIPRPWTYCEPFCGGGSVAANAVVRLRPDRVWLNDRDPAIATLHDAAINDAARLCDAIAATSHPTKTEFMQLRLRYLRGDYPSDPIECAVGKLVVQTLSFSGSSRGTKSSQKFWSPLSLIEQVRRWESIFRGITKVTNDSFEAILSHRRRLLAYCDPCYYGLDHYQVRMTRKQHVLLAELLRTSNHPWLVSYNNSQVVRKLYEWANIIEADAEYRVPSSRKPKAKELLITR